ncbi:MAG TPA: bifunctional methionine sulfoxide reductase B/A protein [Polyangia bacterium]|nr:bifunctional methionine sulfoxide reductase B/A protein [Polyangia bacterium]
MKPFVALTAVVAGVCLVTWIARGRNASVTQAPQRPGLPAYSAAGYDITPLAKVRIAEIVKTLTPEQAYVTQEEGTERAFSNPMHKNKVPGTYVSVVGGLPLFRSTDKFDSGTGWPSFFAPFDRAHVVERRDTTLGIPRTEILDARSGAHLGHVFDDGPPPTGKRYCVNAAALKFIPDGTPLPPESQPMTPQAAYFAGGCFWGVEDVFEQIPGVISAESGYQGGTTVNPSYEDVTTGRTGHAETVKVTFDPNRVAYKDLLKVFFDNHDPTTLNRQGPDHGTQYRSAVFAASAEQLRDAQTFVAELKKSERFRDRKIVTELALAKPFYRAEDYHQDWHAKHGGSCKVVVK